ncbi:hypothetical protein QQS21_000781 [Conoideocrella luteorostrata]|uniref:CPAF-like PDZ domain-containing protein n=1 Tax=Conoideocrella luteorostrata TaxID=1105319 RepID=A0AAJ0D0R2_9HYPO|nr:hypothetical protein QQS21_000781 [Conoideocrella luteorostrata]
MMSETLSFILLLGGLAGFAAAAAAAAVNSCNGDNCLRALRAVQVPGRQGAARSFCTSYMAATGTTAMAAFPTYIANNCKDNQNAVMPRRVSSACSCIMSTNMTTTGTGSLTVTPTTTVTASVHPCAEVSASWSAQLKIEPTGTPTVAASLAHECLKSVPLGKTEGIKLMNYVEPYLEWQSDAAYKKDPPKDYFYPGYDIFGNLAKIKSNLQSDKYDGEYDFHVDFFKQVVAPGADGHFFIVTDLLDKAFSFSRPLIPIVSISEDGHSLPVIKLQKDVITNPQTAQVISKINGIEASKYVQDTVNEASDFQDPDAAYNSMFWSKAVSRTGRQHGGFISGARHWYLYSGPKTSLTFSNGTTIELENKAEVVSNMTGVVDGPSMYKKFCTNGYANTSMDDVAGYYMKTQGRDDIGRTSVSTATLAGYPSPVIATKDGSVSGYYLSGQGFEHIAVTVLSSFSPRKNISTPAEFQAVVSDFLREASAAGKTKLIVDFQDNPGGDILLGYDFFRQLFPSVVQDGNSRFKESNSFTAMSRVVSDGNCGALWFNYRNDLNVRNGNFSTYEDKFAPHEFRDTEYTSLLRWNLSDPRVTTNKTSGIGTEISGYGTRSNLTQYFKSEEIILLYDGMCSSTCGLASEMLRIQGGVKSIAMGGRPNAGPIQAVGGVKGAQVLDVILIIWYASDFAPITNDTNIKRELARILDSPPYRFAGAVNVRDQILRGNVEDGIPAQFVYEAADCRLYWTAPMISDVQEVWKAAANSAFNGAKCAAGGIPVSKAARRFPVPSVPRGHRTTRLSESIDVTPVRRSEKWNAVHRMRAVQPWRI